MTHDSTSNRVTLALAAACIALAFVVGVELLNPLEIEAVSEGTADSRTATVPVLSQAAYLPPRMEELGDVLERPLFFADRKMPPEVAPAAATVAARVPLRLWLEGVAIVSDSRIAVLRDLSNNRLLQLTEGMMHDGWTLDAVTASSARFRRDAEVAELTLDADARRLRR